MGQKPHYFMHNKFIKKHIHDIYDASILSGLYMMKPTVNIDQFKPEIRKFDENMKHKHKVKAFSNASTNIGYMEDPGLG